MAVPKRRVSRSRQGNRRAHHFITPPQAFYCPQCGELAQPHRVCGNCGYFQGRTVVTVEKAEDQK